MGSIAPLRQLQRQYETPTVRMTVAGRAASISQWSALPVVELAHFQLALRADAATEVTVQGDRETFFALKETVETYLQGQLVGAPAALKGPGNPFMEPTGLTQHRLHLGRLGVSAEPAEISLSALQLADLADVFSQLEREMRPLPVPLRAPGRRRHWPVLGTVAAGAIAAVGVTAVLQPWSPPLQQGDVALETAPAPSTPPPEAAGQSQTPAPPEEGAALEPTQTDPPVPSPPLPPEATENSESPEAPGSPEPIFKTKDPSGISAPEPEKPPSPQEASPPASPTTEEGAAEGDTAAEDVATAADMENLDAAPAEPEAEFNVSAGAGVDTAREATEPTDELPSRITSSSPVRRQEPSPSTTPAPTVDLTAVTAAIAQRWQPPADLGQSLVYTLSLAADGTITAITPADERAERYREQAGLPDVGEALEITGASTLQITLRADGTVQVTPLAASDPK